MKIAIQTLLACAIFLVFSVPLSPAAEARSMLNKVENCMGVIDYVQEQLETPKWRYVEEDVKTVQSGLSDYRKYLQYDLLGPAYLQKASGIEWGAKAYQKETDARVASIVKTNAEVFPGNKLRAVHASELYMCGGLILPEDARGPAYLKAVAVMERLSKQ